MIKTLALCAMLACVTYLPTAKANTGQVNFFTEHQALHMIRHRVFNPYAPTGNLPYVGRVGLEYEHKRFTYSLGYIHRSNIDIGGNEYNYDGISLGIKYTHCLVGC